MLLLLLLAHSTIGYIYILICSFNLTTISLSHLNYSYFNSKCLINMQTNNENTTKTMFINTKFCIIAI